MLLFQAYAYDAQLCFVLGLIWNKTQLMFGYLLRNSDIGRV
jgi:hypothetical protein